MKQKDYSTIQRQLGFIEGLVAAVDDYVCEGVVSAVAKITEILDKEVGEDNEQGGF